MKRIHISVDNMPQTMIGFGGENDVAAIDAEHAEQTLAEAVHGAGISLEVSDGIAILTY